MTKTAAIYARVSSDRQKESGTIASQTAALQQCARERAYSVPPEWVFEDDGFSGACLDRPGPGQVRRQAVRQQAHRLPALRAAEPSHPHALGDLAGVAAMGPEPTAPLRVEGTGWHACIAPRLAANVILDGEVCVVANLESAVHGPAR